MSNLAPLPPGEAGPFEQTSVSLDEENLHWLAGLEERTGRSRSELIRHALRTVRAMESEPGV